FDLHSIETRRLSYDSAERGLLREAASRAIERELQLVRVRRKRTDLLYPRDEADSRWSNLRKLVGGALRGEVGDETSLFWNEGIGLRLDWADSKLWLVFEPRIIFEGVTPENRALATDFARERTFGRYNKQLNNLL